MAIALTMSAAIGVSAQVPNRITVGDAAMIQLLLGAGAKADARNKDGLTPLELARKFGHTNLIPALEGTKATN